ncbi:hypothetical protein CHARACLAT_015563 [Characodon lateralis]|uniref:Uncharacterized protein n=1 Tax=Characodon lateralis TaxID=208331 RepID=A0ABU7CRJ2_9TELE|nr:hypothetical protein [Characodon lateralis]
MADDAEAPTSSACASCAIRAIPTSVCFPSLLTLKQLAELLRPPLLQQHFHFSLDIFRDISSYGYGQCQFSGAAGLNPSYQPGHSCAEACRGAASAVGDAARLLFSSSGEL